MALLTISITNYCSINIMIAINTHIYMHVHIIGMFIMHLGTFTYIHACVHTYICTHTHTHTLYACIHTCIAHICLHAQLCICTNTQNIVQTLLYHLHEESMSGTNMLGVVYQH